MALTKYIIQEYTIRFNSLEPFLEIKSLSKEDKKRLKKSRGLQDYVEVVGNYHLRGIQECLYWHKRRHVISLGCSEEDTVFYLVHELLHCVLACEEGLDTSAKLDNLVFNSDWSINHDLF